ncbi:Gx transporter family protein [Carboxydochorda subterranea]|uniref:Gx transporter family protein n=1 Tax=Carboxydichorda subterranea TaxID=3109565 RepID=A0ABZ1BZT3_9FIRM|nr:Gx transporter family protein [Limnochorda sp. L945t]WRP18123.1 Gx transporter family protein [Limnochorda sp. L945t]
MTGNGQAPAAPAFPPTPVASAALEGVHAGIDARIRRLTTEAMLLGMALALHVIESAVIVLPVPGARLGLANAVGLLVLWQWGPGAAARFALVRVLLSSALTGKLGAPGFWLAGAGALASLAVMTLALSWARGRLPRLVVTSVLGGVAHNLGQLLAARYLVSHPGVGALAGPLVPLGGLAGLVTGELARRCLQTGAWQRASGQRPAGTPAAAGWVGLALSGLACTALTVLVAAGAGRLPGAVTGPAGGASSPHDLAAVVQLAGDEGHGKQGAGRLTLRVPLDRDGQWALRSGSVELVLEVRDGRIRVKSSTCPHQVCVHTGWIDRPGQVIVCVPGRAVVAIERRAGASPAWPDLEQGVDAITR